MTTKTLQMGWPLFTCNINNDMILLSSFSILYWLTIYWEYPSIINKLVNTYTYSYFNKSCRLFIGFHKVKCGHPVWIWEWWVSLVQLSLTTTFRYSKYSEWEGWAHKPDLTHLGLVCSPGPCMILFCALSISNCTLLN